MKALSTGMQATIDSGTLPLAWAVKITRPTDGSVIRFVNGTRDVTLEGEAYESEPNFDLSSITCTLGFDVDTLELTVQTANALSQADFLTGRWNGARVEFNQYNFLEPSDGFIPWPTYRVANTAPIVGGFKLELRDLRQLMRQDYTYSTSKLCQNRLGDSRCRVDLYFFTFPFEVTSVTSRTVFTDSALAQADGYFTMGEVRFDDGLHAGLPLQVLRHQTGGVITLARPLIEDITVGQTGVIVAGCRKRDSQDCLTKFDNILNFRGVPQAPTRHQIAGGD